MKKVTNSLNVTIGKHIQPALSVSPGESFMLVTEDAASGYFRNQETLPFPDKRPSHSVTPPALNPLAGPVYIEGAKKGDIIAVKIEKIVPDTQGYTILQPGDGLLGDSLSYRETTEFYTRILRHVPGKSGTLDDGECIFNDNIKWRLAPHIGTLCLAPERESLASVSIQGSFGGNLDSRDFCAGSRILLQSYCDGGLLFAGDVHACMGDGEITDTADECRAEIILSCEVIKNKKIPHVRIETCESVIGVFCDKPLESAVRGAVLNLLDWITGDYGFSRRDAYLLLGTCPDFRINIYQMVDFPGLSYTVGAELPVKYIG